MEKMALKQVIECEKSLKQFLSLALLKTHKKESCAPSSIYYNIQVLRFDKQEIDRWMKKKKVNVFDYRKHLELE